MLQKELPFGVGDQKIREQHNLQKSQYIRAQREKEQMPIIPMPRSEQARPRNKNWRWPRWYTTKDNA